jgi:hypothetical protein
MKFLPQSRIDGNFANDARRGKSRRSGTRHKPSGGVGAYPAAKTRQQPIRQDRTHATSFGGIDFGTSNSTVGVMSGNAPQLLRLEDGSATLPSALFFNFDDDSVSVGRHAVSQYTEGVEGRLLRALKSVLGSSLAHERTRIKKRSMLFSEIIGLFIARLKAKLDAHHGQPAEHVVLGRPVRSLTAMTLRIWPRRPNWSARHGRKAFGMSSFSTSRSPRRSTMSSRSRARKSR